MTADRIFLGASLTTMVLAVAPAARAQQAGFVALGDLPGGSVDSTALGANADGSVVVGSSSSSMSGAFQEAFRWTAGGGMVGLGDLPGGSFISAAFSVSEDGSVVVGESSAGTLPEAFRWTSGGMVSLGTLPGGIGTSSALGVSADGSVIVGASHSASGFEAFRWTAAGGMIGLGDLPGGGFYSTAHAVSATGAVVVGAAEGPAGLEAYRWTASGGMVGLGHLPGASVSSFATAVSADGSVVVGASESALGAEAFRWTSSGGLVSLGFLPGGDASEARGTSADGSVVVGFDHSAASGFRATLWTQALGLVDLQDHLTSLGAVGLSGWTLRMAEAVSGDGDVIVGWGDNPSGAKEAWLAFLSPLPVGTTYCSPAIPNSTGLPGVISASGSSIAATNALHLMADDLPPGQFGYFLAGQTQGLFNPPGSSGLLCLSGDIGRFNQPQHIGQGPSFDIQVDLTAVPQPAGVVAVVPGETWNFQCWYRDLGGSNNFTDAVSVVFQ